LTSDKETGIESSGAGRSNGRPDKYTKKGKKSPSSSREKKMQFTDGKSRRRFDHPH